jgi:hypothetical protein
MRKNLRGSMAREDIYKVARARRRAQRDWPPTNSIYLATKLSVMTRFNNQAKEEELTSRKYAEKEECLIASPWLTLL